MVINRFGHCIFPAILGSKKIVLGKWKQFYCAFCDVIDLKAISTERNRKRSYEGLKKKVNPPLAAHVAYMTNSMTV